MYDNEKIKVETGDYVAIHKNPIWRERANLIVSILFSCDGDKNEWEQLWAEQTGENTAKLCCIPFFVYNMSLGDILEFDANYKVIKIIGRSGFLTFRVWFKIPDEIKREEICNNIKKYGAMMEWSSRNLLALNTSEKDSKVIADYLQSCEDNGLLEYETGQSK